MEKEQQPLAKGEGNIEVSPVQFPQVQVAGVAKLKNPSPLDLLMDVSLEISAELGRTQMSVEEILALGPGSLVELDKRAGEPVDLLINNKRVAQGEIVIIDNAFGIRLTRIL